jgi:ribosomal protein L2
MFLRKSYVTSNASRNIKKITSHWYLRRPHRGLAYHLKGKIGRLRSGRLVCFTKSGFKKRVKSVRVGSLLRSTDVGFLASFRLVCRGSKLLSLVALSCGSYLYWPTTDSSKIFSFIYAKPYNKFTNDRVRRTFSKPYSFLLYDISRMLKISFLEIFPNKGHQYVRSSGCFARIISFNWKNQTALVRLPSGVRKMFSIHTTAIKERISWKWKKRLANTKSGFWRSLGKKPKVRGVARNPVDHPHGGNTKSIRYPRTPWGLTTKYK